MKQFIIRRLGYSLISLFLLSLIIFFFVRVTGDPAVLLVEPGASKADLDAVRHQFGLDQPLPVQYWELHGASRARGLRSVLLLPDARARAVSLAAAELAPCSPLAAMAFSLLIGIPTGIIAAVRVEPMVGQRRERSSRCSVCRCRRSGSAS